MEVSAALSSLITQIILLLFTSFRMCTNSTRHELPVSNIPPLQCISSCVNNHAYEWVGSKHVQNSMNRMFVLFLLFQSGISQYSHWQRSELDL